MLKHNSHDKEGVVMHAEGVKRSMSVSIVQLDSLPRLSLQKSLIHGPHGSICVLTKMLIKHLVSKHRM